MNPATASKGWIGAILIVTALWPAQAAQACTCLAFPNDPEKAVALAFAQADVVFLGEVIALRSAFLGIVRQREVSFSVRDQWKGPISDTTSVRTNIGEIACGYNFEKRGSYLVFAHWDQRRQRLTTSFCDLNSVEAEAKDAIEVLDRLTGRKKASASPGNAEPSQ